MHLRAVTSSAGAEAGRSSERAARQAISRPCSLVPPLLVVSALGACGGQDDSDKAAATGASTSSGAGGAGGGAGGASAGGAAAAGGGAGGGAAAVPFALGAEYADPGLGATYASAGVRWTKTRPALLMWRRIEPDPPAAGAHGYDWSCADSVIGGWQEAGALDVMAYLTTDSYWGSVACAPLSCTDIMPAPAFMADYRSWVRAVVERYDGDGEADMPGLSAPVRHWVVAAEWTGFWPSKDDDDYLVLLEATRDEVKAADMGAQIGLIPFFLGDVFIGNPPSAQSVETALEDPPPAWRNSTSGMMKMLDRPELFDFVDLHSLGDYTEVPPTLAWMRGQMKARGYEKPIWLDDAFPIGWLANGGLWPASHGVVDEQATVEQRLAVADFARPQHDAAQAWIRAEVASGLVKKIVTAAGEGAAGIHIGNTEDWMHDTVVDGFFGRKTYTSLMGAATMMGLVDVTHSLGYEACNPRQAGAPRPAYQNLALVAAKVGAFTKVDKLVGLGSGVWAYRFARATPVIFAWHEDDVLELPDEPEPTAAVAIPLEGASSANVTWAVVDEAATEPVVETLPVTGGVLTIDVGDVPVVIEPVP